MDFRAGIPREYLGFYPGVISQSELEGSINIISKEGGNIHRMVLGPPQETKPIEARENYDTQDPVNLSSFGNTVTAPLGDVALATSGDKGANVNFGLYVHTDEEWDWLRSFMIRAKLQELMGSTWENWFFIERCELPKIKAVHFVVYSSLGRGISSSKILDSLGKALLTSSAIVTVPFGRSFWASGIATEACHRISDISHFYMANLGSINNRTALDGRYHCIVLDHSLEIRSVESRLPAPCISIIDVKNQIIMLRPMASRVEEWKSRKCHASPDQATVRSFHLTTLDHQLRQRLLNQPTKQ